ncbi:nitrogen fixation protein NifQ [Paraburkholderia phenoliruptrix]|uniref:Nitrogen fixation protein NifQ n=1 Tax=Paraburkholderia phenoliruptrix TaxID=252970 RepID=A0ABV3WM25_9BURK
MDYHTTLMRHAAEPNDVTLLALAGVLSAAFDEDGVETLPIPGLGADETYGLLARWFPGADSSMKLSFRTPAGTSQRGSRYDDVDILVRLFKESVAPGAGTSAEVNCVAHALARACARSQHLWQELRLPSRSELSELLAYWFPKLAEKNVHGMRWKKFIYRQLCEREALAVCQASSCGECAEFASCFGPE